MPKGAIGVAAMGGGVSAILTRIQELERLGLQAAWLTTGGAGLDALTLFSAAAVCTKNILLGTCITPTWPRHPIVAVQQIQVVAKLAPGRFRFGAGPSHKPMMEHTFGVKFTAPLTNLQEYIHVVKTLLKEGVVDFEGYHYSAHARIAEPIQDVPVMASALRQGSFRFCGAETDGAISWVCPTEYLVGTALPAMKDGAIQAGRSTPPLIAHMPVCVHNGPNKEVYLAARQQLPNYPKYPFYAQMFADAGHSEAQESKEWSDRLLDAVVLYGNENQVADRLQGLFNVGISEVIVSVVTTGVDRHASWRRTVGLLADL